MALICARCSSRRLDEGAPSVMDRKPSWRCADCGLQMAPNRSSVFYVAIIVLGLAIAAVFGTVGVGLLLEAGGEKVERRRKEKKAMAVKILPCSLFGLACAGWSGFLMKRPRPKDREP